MARSNGRHRPRGLLGVAARPMTRRRRLAAVGALLGLVAGCAAPAPPDATGGGEAGSDLERDREAILAMAGGYRVRFRFRETAVLAPGYERAGPRRSAGRELVLVIDGEGRRIVLQHILVSADGGRVTKHWRQEWRYEASARLEYVGGQTWRLRPLDPAETRGAWTQCVHGVADAPRYCGTGRWRHEHGVSTWTSDRVWRPLPRREHTVRDDYDVLAAVNRHTITPRGWTHEPDNTKLRLVDGGAGHALVREAGFNTYRRDDDLDLGPAREY